MSRVTAPILLGDQLENAIRVCTQSIGKFYRFTGRSTSLAHLNDTHILNICLTTGPFLYYLKLSGIVTPEHVILEINSKLNSLQNADGSFGTSSKSWMQKKGSIIETSFALMALIKLHDTELLDNRKAITQAGDWLLAQLSSAKLRTAAVIIDHILAAYALLKMRQYFEITRPSEEIKRMLQHLSNEGKDAKVRSIDPVVPQSLIEPLLARLVTEMGVGGKFEEFCTYGAVLTENQLHRVDVLLQALMDPTRTPRRDIIVSVQELSLLSYNLLQLHGHYNIPDYLESASLLLRLTSEIVVREINHGTLLFPEKYSLKKSSLIERSPLFYPLRFFLDAAEEGKTFFSCSVDQLEYNTNVNDKQMSTSISRLRLRAE